MDEPVTVQEAVRPLVISVSGLATLADWIALEMSHIADVVGDDEEVPTARECSDLMEWAKQVVFVGAAMMQQIGSLDVVAERVAQDRNLARRNLKHREEVGDVTA